MRCVVTTPRRAVTTTGAMDLTNRPVRRGPGLFPSFPKALGWMLTIVDTYLSGDMGLVPSPVLRAIGALELLEESFKNLSRMLSAKQIAVKSTRPFERPLEDSLREYRSLHSCKSCMEPEKL